ncbi:hypothetical protein KC343_g995 [Hortaea werneckii]|nr:hypothetical protein KC361_g9268 [Hortaea werneckii]KAI6853577.1 hypothetical protein KC323_g9289 [Hortaea werneckii]KAI6855000.1 hypothetical protein KC338_g9044 [Hortaea werneckii]KAI7057068.1 hypothetical protein KC339_g18013 [Hortaea werneckii]KAI7206354.1 hypothetical protein KC365_g17208 [Hortaea werneckii]
MEARGHTRGKSTDKSDVTQPGSPASSEKSDDIGRDSESNAFAGAEGFWDTGFLMRPPGNIRRPVSHRCVGLKPNGSLDLNVNTINSLCGSYLQYIHSIHPFLDKPGLRSLFDRFINKYSRGQEIYGRFTVLHKDDDFERSNKRRRTYDGPDIPNPNDLDTVRAQFPERSAGDAICYLVLALGKICQHSQNLPSVAPDIQMDAKPPGSHRLSSAAIGNPPYRTSMDPSPIPGINSSDPTQSSNDDFHAHHFHMPRGSADGIVNAGGRNLECIPGLAYYTKACEVMGDQADGNDLCHVQMFLLAGLFKEKLGLMEESWSCITIAERASLMLLDRNGLYKRKSGPGQGSLRGGPEMIETKRQNLIVLAAWTCLDQFDGIRAELRFPPRHIQEIEDRLPYPKEVPQDKDTMLSSSRHTVPLVDFCYSSRIWLRQQLNDFSREMYGAAYVNQPLEEVRQTIKRYDNALNRSRRAMPAQLQWSDADPPASDIPAARLRAEYWAVRYVVNRPYLDYALHNWKHVRNGKSVREAAIDAHGRPRDEAEIRLFEAIQGLGETEIWGSVRTCIEAAMQSTVALDRVPAPLVVTNIHATAHA